MCRSIRTLYHFDPPATEDEITAAARQFVRKVSGFSKPSEANRAAFERAVADVSAVVHDLFESLVTHAPARNREVEALRARERSARRVASLRQRAGA